MPQLVPVQLENEIVVLAPGAGAVPVPAAVLDEVVPTAVSALPEQEVAAAGTVTVTPVTVMPAP